MYSDPVGGGASYDTYPPQMTSFCWSVFFLSLTFFLKRYGYLWKIVRGCSFFSAHPPFGWRTSGKMRRVFEMIGGKGRKIHFTADKRATWVRKKEDHKNHFSVELKGHWQWCARRSSSRSADCVSTPSQPWGTTALQIPVAHFSGFTALPLGPPTIPVVPSISPCWHRH